MEYEDRKKIQEIMGDMCCPKDFICVNSGFKQMCRSREFGLDNYLECLEDNPRQCSFSLPYGFGYLCQCPLRVFICKKLGK